MAEVRIKTPDGNNHVWLATANLSGDVTVTLPKASLDLSTAGTDGQFLKTDGAGTLSFATVSTGYTTLADNVTVSGSDYTKTGIPSTAKNVILAWNDLSSAVASTIYIYYGTSSGIDTGNNYFTSTTWIGGGTTSQDSYINKIAIRNTDGDAGYLHFGFMSLWRLGSSNNWVFDCTNGTSGYTGSDARIHRSTGRWVGPGALDRLKIEFTAQNFDDGEVSIHYI